MFAVCLRVSIAIKTHSDYGNSYKGKHYIGMTYSFRGVIHYHHDGTWRHAGRHGAGMDLRFLHFELQAT